MSNFRALILACVVVAVGALAVFAPHAEAANGVYGHVVGHATSVLI